MTPKLENEGTARPWCRERGCSSKLLEQPSDIAAPLGGARTGASLRPSQLDRLKEAEIGLRRVDREFVPVANDIRA
ncbi:MAG TPA: hypothetical protein VM580_23175 [Labilithrix sp.]|nr:hypothetical protein [Labilithrix sp.]